MSDIPVSDIKIISWHADDIPEGTAALGWWGGFFEHGMRWSGLWRSVFGG